MTHMKIKAEKPSRLALSHRWYYDEYNERSTNVGHDEIKKEKTLMKSPFAGAHIKAAERKKNR